MSTARVLLVENELLIRLMAAEMLRDKGFEVIEAQYGEEARALLDDAGNFDVLFTNVRMPGMLNGIDLALHARRRRPAIPVLVASGYAIHLVHRLSMLMPAAVFISKPYRLVDVLDVLHRMTGTLSCPSLPTSPAGLCSFVA